MLGNPLIVGEDTDVMRVLLLFIIFFFSQLWFRSKRGNEVACLKQWKSRCFRNESSYICINIKWYSCFFLCGQHDATYRCVSIAIKPTKRMSWLKFHPSIIIPHGCRWHSIEHWSCADVKMMMTGMKELKSKRISKWNFVKQCIRKNNIFLASAESMRNGQIE